MKQSKRILCMLLAISLVAGCLLSGCSNTNTMTPTETPDMGRPDTGNPDAGNPDTGNPDTGNPDTGNPDTGNPDTGNPDTGNPDTGNPNIDWLLVNLPEPQETDEIRTLKQNISTLEAALNYLTERYPNLLDCSVSNYGSVMMHPSAQESLQREEVAVCDIAPILHYLLEDDLQISTLLAYGYFEEYNVYAGPYTLLSIQYDDHIEILNPADQIAPGRESSCMLTGSFDSLESYADTIITDAYLSNIIHYLYQMQGNNRYFLQLDGKFLDEESVLIRENAPGERRNQISTVEDAIAFLDPKFPILMTSGQYNDPETEPKNFWTLSSGVATVGCGIHQTVGRSDVVHALTYLLGDDMEIYTVIGFAHSETNRLPIRAINCIKTEQGYQFIDPVLQMQGDMSCRYGTNLPEATVSSLDEYVEICKGIPGLSLYIDYLYLFSDSEKIQFVEDKQYLATLIPRNNCQLLWDNTAKNDLTFDQFQKLRASYIDPQYISTYDLYNYLGGTTLTPEGARVLVGAAPEVVKDQVKTASDLLMYMLAANIKACNGCYCDEWNGDVWHTNMNARQVMQTKLGNCGSCANLANYLLEGDYEEVGFLNQTYHPSTGGSGHVYNYIFHEGKYYIVDFSGYVFANYNPEFDYPIPVLDSLEEWGNVYRQSVYNQFYAGTCLIIAYTSAGQQLPCAYGQEQYYDTGKGELYFPEGAEYNVIYDTGDGYKIVEKPFNKAYYDWTVYWGKTDRAPKEPDPNNTNIPTDDEPGNVPVSNANPENIAKYDLYNHLGGTTLTPDGARALVDAAPEVVKEQVKTAADLLMYMMAANIQACDGCYCDEWDGNIWHTNMNARQVMQTKLGNCGSCANLANYLLEGDYEEVGFMDHAYYPGLGGSHVYNYIFHEGKYYIVDFSWYMFVSYTLDLTYPIPVMDSLEEWSQLIKQDVFRGYYTGVNIIVSYTSQGQQLPVVFGEDNCYYLPEGAEYTVWYESPNGYQLEEKPFNKAYYDWTIFWGDTDRTPKEPA